MLGIAEGQREGRAVLGPAAWLQNLRWSLGVERGGAVVGISGGGPEELTARATGMQSTDPRPRVMTGVLGGSVVERREGPIRRGRSYARPGAVGVTGAREVVAVAMSLWLQCSGDWGR
jgi:hypothetical protein